MRDHPLFAPRRIGVCGSSKGLPQEAVWFCEALGRRLAEEPQAVVVAGGSFHRDGAPTGDYAADWHIANAAAQYLKQHDKAERIEAQIETFIGADVGEDETFQLGTLRRARGKTRQARRFSFVRNVDALVAIGGRGGTSQELALAIELGLPVLPVPCFPGAAEETWRAYSTELQRDLRIDAATAGAWEAPDLSSREAVSALAISMTECLVRSLPRRCFVIMPFAEDFSALYDFVIEPCVKRAGDVSIRLDRVSVPGDIGLQISEGIAQSDYVIAVLDGYRANVLYELGVAHGRGKPAILMQCVEGKTSNPVPFDLAAQQRIEYSAVNGALTTRLDHALANLQSKRKR